MECIRNGDSLQFSGDLARHKLSDLPEKDVNEGKNDRVGGDTRQ